MAADTTTQKLSAGHGLVLEAEIRDSGPRLEIGLVKQSGPACVLHWGLIHIGGKAWQRPPKSAWPSGSTAAGQALDTPLGDARVAIVLEQGWRFAELQLAFFDPKNSRWDSNQGRNYHLALPPPPPLAESPAMVARALAGGGAAPAEASHDLDEGFTLASAVSASEDGVVVGLATDVPGPLCLHWGLAPDRRTWKLPARDIWPPDTRAVDDKAVVTQWQEASGLRTLRLVVPARAAAPALTFVLWQPEAELWWKDRGRDFYLPLTVSSARAPFATPALLALADQIVAHETGAGSWTLMHRFNLAWDLLDRLPDDNLPALALIFVWLRFSAMRQLDWQRNYNTKPRELAHAQDRLTLKLGERLAGADERVRPFWRMVAGTLGRGGDGQRVRDGILEIMHRHNVKEVAGHFLEEWHQKLHNNTTPDDVVICEAYLHFLRTGGQQQEFYGVLEAGGVTRERLLGFERPIRSAPDYLPELRDALITDFAAFLAVLRSVHSATDLGGALQLARTFVDEPTRQLLDGIWRRREERQARGWLLRSVTQAREILAGQLQPGHAGVRDLLYLDLALEDFFRVLVERSLHEPLSLDELLEWTLLALRNLALVRAGEELPLCLRHLKRVLKLGRGGPEWALHAQAVLERTRRVLVEGSDADARRLQPMAEYLGQALAASRWAIEGFSDEVLRGRIEFVVSALLRKVDESLRQLAGAGAWQVVSRGAGQALGKVEVRTSLAEAQGQGFACDTVLVVEHIAGEEEIPVGIVAVLTAASVDLLAHVAVRARNRGVLLATAWDGEVLAGLRAKQGAWARLTVAAEGDIVVEDASPPATKQPAGRAPVAPRLVASVRPAAEYVIGEDGFAAENVGGKSRNLKRLRARLPSWIGVPAGVALPYGALARVLGESVNQERARRYSELEERLTGASGEDATGLLAELRALTLALEAPEGLASALAGALGAARIAVPRSFAEAWLGIKRVWASKWNERAHLSRRALGLPDRGLEMAVLVQEVVPADLAFVIHTANPVTGDRNELVAEMVLGLGETLVGNRPGRALGFRFQRRQGALQLTSFPSKSVGLYGGGLMFRSDSNGEDLAGFAGAGLYDSVMTPPARTVVLDYERAELLWNDEVRKHILQGMAELGGAVEGVFGAPQDIEGTFAGGRFFVVQARPQVGLDNG